MAVRQDERTSGRKQPIDDKERVRVVGVHSHYGKTRAYSDRVFHDCVTGDYVSNGTTGNEETVSVEDSCVPGESIARRAIEEKAEGNAERTAGGGSIARALGCISRKSVAGGSLQEETDTNGTNVTICNQGIAVLDCDALPPK